jgi:hypothetical protein
LAYTVLKILLNVEKMITICDEEGNFVGIFVSFLKYPGV